LHQRGQQIDGETRRVVADHIEASLMREDINRLSKNVVENRANLLLGRVLI